MNKWDLISQVRGRVRDEQGTLHKRAGLRVALCYPSPYSVGMSSLGFQAVYREIHRHEGTTAERAFLPDRIQDYSRSRTPVFTYESETPLSEFPVLAFSISYELEITGLLEVLDLSGIPLLRSERDARHPLIIAGGPLTNSNPVPLAPFVDLIMLGEAEETVHLFLEAARAKPRAELLEFMAAQPGGYAPGISTGLPPIAKAQDGCLPARSQIITRNTVLGSMFLIEPERGCSRGCTYCVMRRTTNGGMRLVSPARVMELVPEHARRVGLVGAAVTDHPRIRDIVRSLVESGREIGISSLRADRLDEELVGLLARGGYRTLTTASDGSSRRVRHAVDRKTSEQHLLRAAELARRFRLRRLKVYQLIGLPGEESADIDELVQFTGELARIIPVSLGIAPFVAKRYTPLDGAAFEPIPSLEAKLARLRDGLRRIAEIRPTSARWAWVEYMLSQAGETAGLAAMDARREGGKFQAWQRAFERREVHPFAYRRVADGRRNPPPVPLPDIPPAGAADPAGPG
ncbi:MAG: radical SAM protein [Acidobacteria bacterium]|nr:radical SAM protein [Acidobacteriota bacterium]